MIGSNVEECGAVSSVKLQVQKLGALVPAVAAAGSGHLPDESRMILMRPEPGSATSTEQLERQCISPTSEKRASAAVPSRTPAWPQTPAYVLTNPTAFGRNCRDNTEQQFPLHLLHGVCG